MGKRITIFGATPESLPWIATAIGISKNERDKNSLVGVLDRTRSHKASVKFTTAGVVVHYEKVEAIGHE